MDNHHSYNRSRSSAICMVSLIEACFADSPSCLVLPSGSCRQGTAQYWFGEVGAEQATVIEAALHIYSSCLLPC